MERMLSKGMSVSSWNLCCGVGGCGQEYGKFASVQMCRDLGLLHLYSEDGARHLVISVTPKAERLTGHLHPPAVYR